MTITPLGVELRERARRVSKTQHREALLSLVDRQDATIRRLKRERTQARWAAFFLAMFGLSMLAGAIAARVPL